MESGFTTKSVGVVVSTDGLVESASEGFVGEVNLEIKHSVRTADAATHRTNEFHTTTVGVIDDVVIGHMSGICVGFITSDSVGGGDGAFSAGTIGVEGEGPGEGVTRFGSVNGDIAFIGAFPGADEVGCFKLGVIGFFFLLLAGDKHGAADYDGSKHR